MRIRHWLAASLVILAACGADPEPGETAASPAIDSAAAAITPAADSVTDTATAGLPPTTPP